MADTLILLRRNTPPEGSPTQSVDVLANRWPDYWLWSVQGIDVTYSDAEVQAYLDTQVDVVIAAILAEIACQVYGAFRSD